MTRRSSARLAPRFPLAVSRSPLDVADYRTRRCRTAAAVALLGMILAASASLAALPPEAPVLDTDRRAALIRALQDAAFEPWQRDFLRELVEAPAGATAPADPEAFAGLVDGAWSIVPPPSARYGQTAVYDIIHDRMIVFGGSDNFLRNDVWLYSFGASEWTRLKPSGLAPSERYRHSAIYDLRRDRLVVFGGVDEGNDRNDVWTLTLSGRPAWTQLTAFGESPPVRREHTAIFDAGRDRMIIMGGVHDGSVRNDLWALSLSGLPVWTRLDPTGTGPGPRYRHTAVYDHVAGRMLVFGGDDGTSMRGELWSLSLVGREAWTVLSGTGPAPRGEHSAIYDAAAQRMVVYGGSDGTTLLDDVWTYSLRDAAGWVRQTPPAPPSARHRHSAIFDPIRKRMLIYGGLDPFKTSETWALTLAGTPSWHGIALLGTPPSPRSEHSSIYDPLRDRVILFGGHKTSALLDETWVLSLAGAPRWTKMNEPDPTPAPRLGHTAIHDPRLDRMIVWGGVAENGEYFGDAWQLSLAGNPSWSRIPTSGDAPPARAWHSAVYDHARHRMIVWGGSGAEGATSETWALALGSATWTRLAADSRPPLARANHCAVYDPLRDRMLVLAGHQYTHQAGVYFDDIWALDLATETWSNVALSGVPDGLLSATYDPLRHRIVTLNSTSEYRSLSIDAYELPLAGPPTWTALLPSGSSPSIRERSAIYDPIRDRAVLFGGDEGHFLTGDTWVLAWNQPARPSLHCLGVDYSPGDAHVVARFLVGSPLGGERAVTWKLTDQRGWPTLPLEGMSKVHGPGSDTLVVSIPVPSAPTPTNRFRLTLGYCGAPGAVVSCERDLVDVTTATLAALMTASAEPGLARLAWQVATAARVTIERREPASEWVALERVAPREGRVGIEDRSVHAGARYGYRLAWNDGRGPVVAGEQWLDVPQGNGLALLGARPNPATERFEVAFTLPGRGRATLQVFDLAGRMLASRALDRGAGFHVTPFPEMASWRPGLYLVRLRFGDRTLETRVARVR